MQINIIFQIEFEWVFQATKNAGPVRIQRPKQKMHLLSSLINPNQA